MNRFLLIETNGYRSRPRTPRGPDGCPTMTMTRTQLLAHVGLVDGPELIVEADKEADIFWGVAIYALGNPKTCLAPTAAERIANYIRQNGDKELANRIMQAVETARLNATSEMSKS